MVQTLKEQINLDGPGNQDEEISLIDIFRFLNNSYKTILLTVFLGLVIAGTYLLVTPKRYEAIAQIAMAQISASNNNNNNNLNPLGINIEEPTLLISRLSSPTSFSPAVIDACDLEGVPNPGSALVGSIKLTPVKGVANVVELKTFGSSPVVANSCAQAIFELIRATQSEIIAPYIEEARSKLTDDQGRLLKAQTVVAKADQSGQAMSASYLATRDEIRYLLDEITSLKNVVSTNQSRATRLVAPIYASDSPVAPKKQITLLAGLLGGLVLGLLVALGRQVLAKIKAQTQGVLWWPGIRMFLRDTGH